jgi:predicted transcriptional regulator of viral defense system
MLRAKDYVAALAARGVYHFTTDAMRLELGGSPVASKLALSRLVKQGLVANPVRGFHVILPPEYKSLGCLPADQFIPALMQGLKIPYYTALLSAAQYHGAAHHRPQEFQVLVPKARKPITCGSVRAVFFARKRIAEIPTQSFNTPRGTVLVSTVEATAFDLVGYAHHAGGLDQIATVLAELAEQIKPDQLAALASTAPVPWAQRLGYLLERIGAGEKTIGLKKYVRETAKDTAPLLPGAFTEGMTIDKSWRLIINTEVEVEDI